MPVTRARLDESLRRAGAARTDGDIVALAGLANDGVALARQCGERAVEAQFAALEAYALWRLDQTAAARDLVLETLPEARVHAPASCVIDLLHTLAMTYSALSAPAEGLPHAHEALRLAREHADEVGQAAVSWSLNRLAVLIDGLGDTPRALDQLREASELTDGADDGGARFAACLNIAALCRLAADRARVEEDAENQDRYAQTGLDALATAEALSPGHGYRLLPCAEHEASLSLLAGHPVASLAAVARHRALQDELGLPSQDTVISLVEVRALLALGRVHDAKVLYEGHVDQEVFDVDDVYVNELIETRMLLARALGRFEEALRASELLRARERKTVRQRVEGQLQALLRDAEIVTARSVADRLREQATLLRQRAASAVAASLHDPLTGLANRRALADFFTARAAAADPAELTIAVVDLDHFKRVNDAFGHDVGDLVLREIAELLTSITRSTDIVARTGGEEFVVVSETCPPHEAFDWADRIRAGIADHGWDALVPGLPPVTASVGATISGHDDGADELLRRADRAMYEAKRAGRNRAEIDGPHSPSSR